MWYCAAWSGLLNNSGIGDKNVDFFFTDSAIHCLITVNTSGVGSLAPHSIPNREEHGLHFDLYVMLYPRDCVPFSSPPAPCRATVKVFKVKVNVTLQLMVSQSVSLCVEPHLGLMTRYLLLFDSYGLVFMGRPLWLGDGSVSCVCCWPSPAQSFLGRSPLGLATIFYYLRFETSIFVAFYDSQGHGGGIWSCLHTGVVEVRVLTTSSSFIAVTRTAQETSLPVFRVLS
jgi:hypothetical protein